MKDKNIVEIFGFDKKTSFSLCIAESPFPKNLYQHVIEKIEGPLIEQVFKICKSNQSETAIILGIIEALLRDKLKHYRLVGN